MTVYGYARVSTQDQTTATQMAALLKSGIEKKNIVQEKKSAVKTRPALEQLLRKLKKGDVLVVYKLDRLARSVSHFIKVFEDLQARRIGNPPINHRSEK